MPDKSAINSIIFYMLFALFIGCSGMQQQDIVKPTAQVSLSSKHAVTSRDSIDNSQTFEVRFVLSAAENCISVELNALAAEIDPFNKPEAFIPYFIVERDLQTFSFVKNKQQHVYTEIARNFTDNWDAHRKIILCSHPDDPLKKLDAGAYRIRFTICTKTEAQFDILLYTKNPSRFEDHP